MLEEVLPHQQLHEAVRRAAAGVRCSGRGAEIARASGNKSDHRQSAGQGLSAGGMSGWRMPTASSSRDLCWIFWIRSILAVVMHDTPQPGPARLVAPGDQHVRVARVAARRRRARSSTANATAACRVEDRAPRSSPDVCSDCQAHPDARHRSVRERWQAPAGVRPVPDGADRPDHRRVRPDARPARSWNSASGATPHDGRTDVKVRGEETTDRRAGACSTPTTCPWSLPGTHTKWVRISAHQALPFTTAMTGEL